MLRAMTRVPLSLLFVVAIRSGCGRDSSDAMKRYGHYRSMSRITEERINVPKRSRMLCADPTMIHGVHYKPGIQIYANTVALGAPREAIGSIRYPIGSIFVKEKFDTDEESTPSIITVMEKVANTGKV